MLWRTIRKPKALARIRQSLRFSLYMQYIPENPPSEEKDDIGVERVGMVGEATKGVVARKDAVGQENEQEEGDGEDEEIVVGKCFGEMTVQCGMNGSLESTRWALCVRQHSPHAFRYEWGGSGGIHCIVKDTCQQDDDKDEELEGFKGILW